MRRRHQDGSGSASSFDAAFKDLFAQSYRVARRIVGDAALAEDIAAEALSRTYAHWSRIGDLPHRDAWVLRVTTTLALNTFRRRNVVLREPSPERYDDAAATRLSVAAAIQALPARQREVIVLRHFAELSEREVAAHLGVSLGTVKTHLRRAKDTLRGQLELDMLGSES
jgi:RNA polymerase sigma-70 factor (sigma-E family)